MFQNRLNIFFLYLKKKTKNLIHKRNHKGVIILFSILNIFQNSSSGRSKVFKQISEIAHF